MSGGIDRREFLRRGAATGLGAGLLPLSALAAPVSEGPRVRRRVRLGRTGLRVSDISFGSSRLSGDEALVRHALERGIDYFDTAEGYTGGQSEETLGRALAGHREKISLASKTHCEPDSTRESLMRSLENSLRRLRTDRIEVYFNHAVNDVARLKNPEWFEFASRAKQQGKIRFTGMSGHGGLLIECLDHALDEDMVDVILVAHNFGQDESFFQRFTRRMDWVARQPDLPRVLAKAKQKDVGVVAMKTLMGARLNDLRPYETGGASFAQAAFRWVLSGPHVDALVVTMSSPKEIDEYLGASGWNRPDAADLALLYRYVERNSTTQCRYGCNDCAGACPAGVPIHEVLRTGMYARDYGDLALAREDYAKLGAGAAACLSCTARPCAGACPQGLRLESLVEDSHRRIAG